MRDVAGWGIVPIACVGRDRGRQVTDGGAIAGRAPNLAGVRVITLV